MILVDYASPRLARADLVNNTNRNAKLLCEFLTRSVVSWVGANVPNVFLCQKRPSVSCANGARSMNGLIRYIFFSRCPSKIRGFAVGAYAIVVRQLVAWARYWPKEANCNKSMDVFCDTFAVIVQADVRVSSAVSQLQNSTGPYAAASRKSLHSAMVTDGVVGSERNCGPGFIFHPSF